MYGNSLFNLFFYPRLDPEDPLAILLLIDFFALKSDQNDYLIQIFNEWEVTFFLFISNIDCPLEPGYFGGWVG